MVPSVMHGEPRSRQSDHARVSLVLQRRRPLSVVG